MRNGGRGWMYALLVPMGVVLVLFLGIPVLLVVVESVRDPETGRLTLEYYARAFTRRLFRDAMMGSLTLATVTTIVGTVLGLVVSYGVFRSRPRMQRALMTLSAVPLTFSGLVIAFAFIVTFGSSGFVTLLISRVSGWNPLDISDFLFTWRGLVVAYLYFLIPRMVLVMMAAWSNADWSLVEAAESLGASRWTTWWRVTFPMLAPSILAGSSLLFAVSMGAFGTAFALTGTGVNILPLLVYTQVSEVSANLGQADALAVVLTVVTSLVVLLYQRIFPAGAPGAP